MLPLDELQKAVESLKSGGVVLFPTDTIWGLGCDPWDQNAFNRIYDIKKRSKDKPLLLLVSSLEELKFYVPKLHPRVETLLTWHNRPLTLIHPKCINLPDYVKAADGSIGIRIVSSGICHELLKAFGKPLTSTSPNKASDPTPASFGNISSEILAAVDHVLMSTSDARIESEPSVIATYDHTGELNFLRT